MVTQLKVRSSDLGPLNSPDWRIEPLTDGVILNVVAVANLKIKQQQDA